MEKVCICFFFVVVVVVVVVVWMWLFSVFAAFPFLSLCFSLADSRIFS